jgi:hypothetical protein
MVWNKRRTDAYNHIIEDTARGTGKDLYVNLTFGQGNNPNRIISFNSNGVTLGFVDNDMNASAQPNALWTFRKAPKFFDVVTYTGTGSARTIAHNLGIAPGCIIVKRTDTTSDWQVYHRSNANTEYMVLNTTAAKATGTTRWNSTTPTATEFTVGTDTTVNASGGTYVAYLFAHDTAADGIIQCGSYTGNGSAAGPTVTLGWEPQWLMIKRATGGTGNWQIIDNMRGMPVGTADAMLQANLTNAESAVEYVSPTATGFQLTSTSSEVNASGSSYIYIAIRRGPMKTPTVGTSVFVPSTASGNITTNFPSDAATVIARGGGDFDSPYWATRLTGANSLTSSSTAASQDNIWAKVWASNTQFLGGSSANYASYNFRRAPGFFDVVAYTGNGVAGRTVNHNLGVVPELIIAKSRSTTGNWGVVGALLGWTNGMYINTIGGSGGTNWFTTPTGTTFVTGPSNTFNTSGTTYIAYLFASCPGVSKVGSYTGNGSNQTINCGFSSGARFFLVKRTDNDGDWWVWDSARGIVTAADPALRLNSTAAEVTSADAVDTASTGIIVNQETTCNINVNGATYIFLAVA